VPTKGFNGKNPREWTSIFPRDAHIAIEVATKDKEEAI
jgi:hypothetical protein